MPDHQMLSRSFQPRPIIDPVATRPYGMRDFTVEDPDGHRFTLGQADDSLPDVARRYGLNSDEIVAKPELAQGSHLAVADQGYLIRPSDQTRLEARLAGSLR